MNERSRSAGGPGHQAHHFAAGMPNKRQERAEHTNVVRSFDTKPPASKVELRCRREAGPWRWSAYDARTGFEQRAPCIDDHLIVTVPTRARTASSPVFSILATHPSMLSKFRFRLFKFQFYAIGGFEANRLSMRHALFSAHRPGFSGASINIFSRMLAIPSDRKPEALVAICRAATHDI